jgi:Fic family protein
MASNGLYLSHYFRQHRQTYYDRLQAVRDHGEWEEWLVFFLRGVVEVAKEAAATAKQILQLREDHRAAITGRMAPGAANGHKVLERLFDRPILSVNDVREITGITFAAANNIVSRLVDLGILSQMTGNARNRRFSYSPGARFRARVGLTLD